MQVTYSTLIDGCVRAGDADTGKALLSEMLAQGVKPNVVTYNTLLRAYATDEHTDMQVCLFRLLLHCCNSVPCSAIVQCIDADVLEVHLHLHLIDV